MNPELVSAFYILVMLLGVVFVPLFILAAIVGIIRRMFGAVAGNRSNYEVIDTDTNGLDPQRLFTAEQKAAAMRACNYQCENIIGGTRCSYRGNDLHGDHWFPHSKGGATTVENLVMLCPACNRAKYNHIPTERATAELNAYRAQGIGYLYPMPPVGQWYMAASPVIEHDYAEQVGYGNYGAYRRDYDHNDYYDEFEMY